MKLKDWHYLHRGDETNPGDIVVERSGMFLSFRVGGEDAIWSEEVLLTKEEVSKMLERLSKLHKEMGP